MNEYIDAWARILDFNGVSSKKEYWIPFSINILIGLLYMFLSIYIQPNNLNILSTIFIIYMICWLLPGISLFVRRMHDTNKSGSYFWLLLVPFAGIILVLYYLAQPSVVIDNKYIQDLSRTKTNNKNPIVFLLLTIMVILGIGVGWYIYADSRDYNMQQQIIKEEEQKSIKEVKPYVKDPTKGYYENLYNEMQQKK